MSEVKNGSVSGLGLLKTLGPARLEQQPGAHADSVSELTAKPQYHPGSELPQDREWFIF